MGGCLSWCLLSCLNCFATQIGNCCLGLMGRQKFTKLFYIVLDILIVVPAAFLFYLLQNWTWFKEYFGTWVHCPDQSGGSFSCFGISMVYRLSFSLLLLYLLLVLIMLCRNRCAKVVNQGLFFVKYLMVVGMIIGFLFVNNQVFLDYGLACKIIGLIFLLLQSIILIDLFYMWGINWVKKYNEGQEGCYGTLLITFSIIFYAGALAVNIYGYVAFASCTVWVNIITSILILLLPGIQLAGWNKQGSLLTSSVVCLYLSYLSLIAQYSWQPCNALTKGAMAADLSTSTCLFFLTMYGSVMGGSGVLKVNEKLGVAAPTEQHIGEENGHEQVQPPPEPKKMQVQEVEHANQSIASYESWGWVKWHIYMAIGSMYIAMMITNWGSPSVEDTVVTAYKPNGFSFWSRIGLEWATALLYLWTLVAPKIFPERNFQVE